MNRGFGVPQSKGRQPPPSFYRSVYSEIEEVGWQHLLKLEEDLSFLSFRVFMDVQKIQASQPISEKKTKKQWTPDEDEVLVEALFQLASSSYWKADNGFRAGYLTELQKMMALKIPNCDIRASPHIESRVKLLKKHTNAITEMIVVSSGCITWDEAEKCIKCEKKLFQDWVKSHPQAAGLRNKPFIHYDTLCEVFGQDRACGSRAETLTEAVEDIDNTPDVVIDDDIAANIIERCANGDEFLASMGTNMDANVDANIDINIDANMDENMDFSSSSHTPCGQPSPPEDSPSANHFTPGKKGIPANKGTIHKKRSRASEGSSDALREIASSFKDFVDISKEHIVHIKENQEVARNFHTSLTTILERDQELKEREHEVRKRDQLLREREVCIKEMQEMPSQKRTRAISELMKISCFSRMEGFTASTRIGSSDTNVDLFLALGEADRITYVKELLRQGGQSSSPN